MNVLLKLNAVSWLDMHPHFQYDHQNCERHMNTGKELYIIVDW